MPLVHQEKLGSIEELVKNLQSNSSKALQEKVIEAMTTNETSFFRDLHPFELLKPKYFQIFLKQEPASVN